MPADLPAPRWQGQNQPASQPPPSSYWPIAGSLAIRGHIKEKRIGDKKGRRNSEK